MGTMEQTGQHRGRMRGQALARQWLPPLIAFVLGLLLWEGAVRLLNIASYLLPAPSAIVSRLGTSGVSLLSIGWYTFQEALLGFLLGCSLGIVAAMCSVHWRWMAAGLLPFGVASNAVPIIALAPLVGVWFGSTQQTSKIVIVAIMTFFPTLINTYRGLISPTSASLELMHSYAATPMEVFVKLRVPAALPYFFNALKICTTLSLIGAVVSEFFGGPLKALGVYIISQSTIGHYVEAWSAIVVACALGILFYLIVVAAERLAMPWHVSRR